MIYFESFDPTDNLVEIQLKGANRPIRLFRYKFFENEFLEIAKSKFIEIERRP